MGLKHTNVGYDKYPDFDSLPDVLSREIIQKFLHMSPNNVLKGLKTGEIPGRFLCGRWQTGKHEFGVHLGIIGENHSLVKEIQLLRKEFAELKERENQVG